MAAHHVEDAPAQAVAISGSSDERHRSGPQQGAEISHHKVPQVAIWALGGAKTARKLPAVAGMTRLAMKASASAHGNTRELKSSSAPRVGLLWKPGSGG